MRFWPWRKPETRSSYVDLVVAAIVDAVTHGAGTSPLASGALEIAAGFFARAFAAAEVVNGPDIVTPSFLASIGRALIRSGQSVHVIGGGVRGLQLRQIGAWDVKGISPDPATWTYVVEEDVPDGSRARAVPDDGVVVCRYSTDASRPWVGLGPLQVASATGTLVAHAERSLSEELSSPVGHVIPVPPMKEDTREPSEETPADPKDLLRADLGALKGGLALVDSFAGGLGERGNRPDGDWAVKRLGPNPPVSLVDLRQGVILTTLSACGVPPSLALLPADGASQRESWRRFGITVGAVGRLVEEELQRKLDAPDLALDFSAMSASDVVSKARAVGSLTKSGVEVDDALAIAGLT